MTPRPVDHPTRVPRAARAVLIVCALLPLAACGNELPTPRLGRHTENDPFAIVPYKPPPAHVEVVPLPPEGIEDPVWIDGEWQWHNRRWVWVAGRWEEPFPDATYAPATTVRRPDGGLVWFGGLWHFPSKKR